MHCINIILIKKSELRNHNIDSILEGKETPTFRSTQLPQDILAFPEFSCNTVSKVFGEGVTFVQASTDYFGGMGEQDAVLAISTQKGYKVIRKSDSIDDILGDYGIVRTGGQDEFDSINLGNYRTNEDFYFIS